MATIPVVCPQCNVATTVTYPDDFAGILRWEHGCPPADEHGNLIPPYQGTELIGEPAATEFPPVPEGVVAIRDDEVGTGTSGEG
jgi:hypothetical protein